MGINAKDKSSAFRAFRDSFSSGAVEKNIKNAELDGLLNQFLSTNPDLGDYLFTDQGIRLMNLDGQITAKIHNNLTQQGIPVLSIHDSYIVMADHITPLRQAMTEASEDVMGRPLPFQTKLPGREEFEGLHDNLLMWEVWKMPRRPRASGYERRLEAFERRTGRAFPL